MAQVAGVKGSWGYPEGGMGGVTQAIAQAATQAGAHLFTSKVMCVCVCVCVCKERKKGERNCYTYFIIIIIIFCSTWDLKAKL